MMTTDKPHTGFETLNNGFNRTFQQNKLSIGVIAPLESYTASAVPTMQHHLERIQLVEDLGFSAVWLRDVPFNVASFGDAGQIYDPFVYLGLLSAQTQRIALGVASLVLPLRHPVHIAKAAASVDHLSNGRLLLGVASGDRPEEYPALNVNFAERSQLFRESFNYINRMSESSAAFDNIYGQPSIEMDLLPKPTAGKLPLFITGGSQQDPDWIAQHGAGWITYPRAIQAQEKIINDWRTRIKHFDACNKPAVQSLYIDLLDDDNAPAEPIHLGIRSGINALREHLYALQRIGINHVALNLRFNRNNIEATLQQLAKELLTDFSTTSA